MSILESCKSNLRKLPDRGRICWPACLLNLSSRYCCGVCEGDSVREVFELVETGTYLVMGPWFFARFAHLLPQYGCTVVPSLYFGIFLQYFRGSEDQSLRDIPHVRNVHTHVTQAGTRVCASAPTDIGASWRAPQRGTSFETKRIVKSRYRIPRSLLGIAFLRGCR